jgi:hypothetical protein
LRWFGGAGVEAKRKKKKKKPCASKCKDGCCTAKFGACISPAQQNATRCGVGGQICRSTNCGGGGCGAGCNTCCAGGVCIDEAEISNEQCGTAGEACFACPQGQACNAPDDGCCALPGTSCGTNLACCLHFQCRNATCCMSNFGTNPAGFCSTDDDCCDEEDSCVAGQCLRDRHELCTPAAVLCQSPLTCTSVGNIHRCCAANGAACEADADCCEDEDVCDGGVCKRKRQEPCDPGIVCRDSHPFCVFQRCLKCPENKQVTGTDELCCDISFGCDAANGGRGACCQNPHCCESVNPCVLEFGLQSC